MKVMHALLTLYVDAFGMVQKRNESYRKLRILTCDTFAEALSDAEVLVAARAGAQVQDFFDRGAQTS